MSTAPSIWLNHPLLGLQALHAPTKYTAGVQLCVGVGFHQNSQIGAVYAHTEAIHALQCEGKRQHPFEPCREEGHPLVHPHVYILAQGACQKTVDFFLKICSTYLVIFTHLDHERIVLFQVSGTVYDA